MIQILDCTLRDGGYLNDWRFGTKTMRGIVKKLTQAHIDIIECGFLTGMVQEEGCSLFASVEAAEAVLPEGKRRAMYVAMIAIGEKELHPSELAPCSGRGITGIRLTFHQAEIDQAIEWARIIQDKGYAVFMQPVGMVFYTDLALLQLVERMNELRPFALYIVDTLGSMYRNDVTHRFHLIDKNLAPGIHIGFHAHNNLQLAFSNAQVLGKIQTRRTLILDASVYGMGRGAGNLPTELITQYINKNIKPRYDVTQVMDIYDEYIAFIRKKFTWGYSMPYHIAASHVCHPNYASYLLNKQTLTMKDIERIILSIPPAYKILYDRRLIHDLYTQYQSRHIDDSAAVAAMQAAISDRPLLLLAPGASLRDYRTDIQAYIDRVRPYVIAINFVDSQYPLDACFISNHKRLDIMGTELRHNAAVQPIVTSNIPLSEVSGAWHVDYDRYTNDDELASDNAGLMLLQLLQTCGATACTLAGFDGFPHRLAGNYYAPGLNLPVNDSLAAERQERIRRQLNTLRRSLSITFLTPSLYDTPEGEHHV